MPLFPEGLHKIHIEEYFWTHCSSTFEACVGKLANQVLTKLSKRKAESIIEFYCLSDMVRYEFVAIV